MISRSLLWLGIACVVSALLLLSPLADFLPLDLWTQLQQFLLGEEAQRHAYQRVVPHEARRVFEFTTLGIGALLIAASRHIRAKQ